MPLSTPITGGCACGAIRYECTEGPMEMFCCHCRECQRASGGAYSPAMLFPVTAFKITQGTPKYHDRPSEAGGQHTRGFCPDCGSRLFGAVNPTFPFIGVVASSLDDPSIFKPAYHIFTADAQPWDIMDAALPKHEGYAPM